MSEVKPRIRIVDSKLITQRDYWLKQLSREFQPSNLRLDYNREDASTREMETVELSLSDGLFRKLAQISGESQFLLYTALMAGLHICLHKHTFNKLVVVGSPSRRRDGASSQSLNALPILSEIDTQISFREFLVNVRETLNQAYKNQNYPYDRLLRDLKLTQPENRCALFDVSLALTNIHTDIPDIKNDIAILFSNSGSALSGSVTYNSALFMRDTVERFIGQFEMALSTGLENPEILICDLEILPEAERNRVLVEWNSSKRGYPQKCIHELFESQVDRTPDRVALEIEGNQLTYKELNRAANKLARYLRANEVGPEVIVGICVERSLEMIIGVLGVLKAGGAFVPLDPFYPAQRLALMQEDSNVKVLLMQQMPRENFSKTNATVIYLDSDWPVIEREIEENIISGVTPDNLAYMIYTSGSSGRPKGVLIQHEGIGNLADAQVEAFEVQPDSRVLQFASLSFDASISEIFMALTTGAALHLGSKDPLVGTALFQLLSEEVISHATVPPAILATLPGKDLPALQTLIVAGESCPPNTASRWSIGRRFFNAYGPTETTVCASIFECTDEYKDGPPIGRPMANTEIYLLASRLNPVPIGVPGEIHVDGVGLARGYFNRSDFTAEQFIPNPFTNRFGARLYRTGDLARHMFDGTIQYLGRVDRQGKIRGFRIELGEIESVLGQHPGVREVVAVIKENSPADKRLVVYFTTYRDKLVYEDELRSFLKERLPAYMIPSAIMPLESLPLTPNGKVDFRALPDPTGERSLSQETFVAARNPVEEVLNRIWTMVLRIERIGVDDNFFELGGNSILATQVISRVHDALQIELPLRTLFEAPTIGGLAANIERIHGEIEVEEEGIPAHLLSKIEQLSDEEAVSLLMDWPNAAA
jgi:amino acid adenylation domain-containing protein